MKRVSLLIAAIALAGSTATAVAGHQAGHDEVHAFQGVGQGCMLVIGGQQATVGEMMRTLRTRTDGVSGNPKQIVDAYPDESWGNVGGLIKSKCGDPS